MIAVFCALDGLRAAALWWIRRRTVVITVKGVSMRPTLGAGDVLIGRRVRGARLRSGQVVVIEKPDPGADRTIWS